MNRSAIESKSARVCSKATLKSSQCSCCGSLEPISEDEFSGILSFACKGHRGDTYRKKPEQDLYAKSAKQSHLPIEEDPLGIWEGYPDPLSSFEEVATLTKVLAQGVTGLREEIRIRLLDIEYKLDHPPRAGSSFSWRARPPMVRFP